MTKKVAELALERMLNEYKRIHAEFFVRGDDLNQFIGINISGGFAVALITISSWFTDDPITFTNLKFFIFLPIATLLPLWIKLKTVERKLQRIKHEFDQLGIYIGCDATKYPWRIGQTSEGLRLVLSDVKPAESYITLFSSNQKINFNEYRRLFRD